MILYLAVSGVVSGLAMLSDMARRQLAARARREQRVATWGLSDALILLTLVSLSGLRYYVGTDFWIYWSVYNRLDVNDWATSISNSPHEIGYTVFSLVVKSLTDEASAIVWATSLAAIVPMYIAIKRLSPNRALSVFVYLAFGTYFVGFNQIRQSIALGLTALAYSYAKKSRLTYAALIALAATFHVSALIVPLVQLITARWKATPLRVTLLAGSVGVLGIALASLTNFASAFNERYGAYIEDGAVAGAGTLVLAAVRVAVVIWGLTAVRRHTVSADTNRFILYVTVGAGLILMGYISVPVARLEMYFSTYAIFLIPILTSLSRAKRTSIWIVVVIGLAHMLIHIATFNSVIPYQTLDGFVAK